VNDSVGDQVLCLARINHHVGRVQVRLQRLARLPLFNDHKSVGAKIRLEFEIGTMIDGGFVLETTVLGVDGWHIGRENFEDGIALTAVGSDYGNDVDHGMEEEDCVGRIASAWRGGSPDF